MSNRDYLPDEHPFDETPFDDNSSLMEELDRFSGIEEVDYTEESQENSSSEPNAVNQKPPDNSSGQKLPIPQFTKNKKGLSEEEKRLLADLKNQDALNIALSGKSEFFQLQVLTLMTRCRLQPNDPVFLLVIAMAEMEASLANYPITMHKSVNQFTARFEELTEQLFSSQAIEAKTEEYLQDYQNKVIETAQQIIRMARDDEFIAKVFGISRSLWLAIALLGTVFVGGILATKTYYKLFNRSLISAGKITVEDYNDLAKIRTKEGQLALNILEWNKGALTDIKNCQKEYQKLGLKANFRGREVAEGLCVLFVAPEEQRK